MSEKTAINIVLLILTIISVFCLSALLVTNLDKFEDKNSIFALINIGIFWKIYLGMKRYFLETDFGRIEPSGLKLLEFSLFRFF
ncbi:hypothetical protein CXF95_01365 [Paraglaciecola sp. MB-3u-78]|nr:hypothetical protein CXF95_01365 [Paraglaciecola sp. MB-3u-78]